MQQEDTKWILDMCSIWFIFYFFGSFETIPHVPYLVLQHLCVWFHEHQLLQDCLFPVLTFRTFPDHYVRIISSVNYWPHFGSFLSSDTNLKFSQSLLLVASTQSLHTYQKLFQGFPERSVPRKNLRCWKKIWYSIGIGTITYLIVLILYRCSQIRNLTSHLGLKKSVLIAGLIPLRNSTYKLFDQDQRKEE